MIASQPVMKVNDCKIFVLSVRNSINTFTLNLNVVEIKSNTVSTIFYLPAKLPRSIKNVA